MKRFLSSSKIVEKTGRWQQQSEKAKIPNESLRELAGKLHSNAGESIDPRYWPSNLLQSSVYEPSDFGFARIRYAKTRRNEKMPDQFVKESINPIDLWTDPVILSHYITVNGKIRSGNDIGNKGPTQRKLAKAIRRARAAGLLSTVHRDVSELPKFAPRFKR